MSREPIEECMEGYSCVIDGAQTECDDDNECELELDDCDDEPDACVNTPGSFSCECPPDHVGTGVGTSGCRDTSTGRLPSAGCGEDPEQALGQYVAHTVPLTGATLGEPHSHTERRIHVWLPPDYETELPYRVVYIGVGCQAGSAAAAGYQLYDDALGGSSQAIYVAIDLPNPPTNNNCYDTRSGVDSIEWESWERMQDFVGSRFCTDESRLYLAGYSSGGFLANMFACYFAGVPDPPRQFAPAFGLRGAMSVSGGWSNGNPECSTSPVARLWIHDEADGGASPISGNLAQLDRVLAQNGCTGSITEPWGTGFFTNGTCLNYVDCGDEHPVIFCTTQGQGHNYQPANAIRSFTAFMESMEPGAP